MTKKEASILFNLKIGKIPEFVKYLSKEIPALSTEQLQWAKDVAMKTE